MFTNYTPDEVQEIVTAGSSKKKGASVSYISQEEKLFYATKHVRLFDGIEMEYIQKIVSDVKIDRYQSGDTMDMGGGNTQMIHYVMSGCITMPLEGETQVELGKDQVFGEVGAFTKTNSQKIINIADNNTMIFSFKINKNELSKDTAEAFVKLYEALLMHTTNKLLWFDLI